MEAVKFDSEEIYIKEFLSLPSRLYSKKEIVQSRSDEEQLLRGTHYISKYVKFTPFLVMEGDVSLARCGVTQYPDQMTCYFGFFECVEDNDVFNCLMNEVEMFAMNEQYSVIEGPLDASMWIRYRFKSNLFELPPYLGEPYNKEYYPVFFEKRGYKVKETYASNIYSALPKEKFELSEYQNRWNLFNSGDYEIRSPKIDEWDESISEIYKMISVLYKTFLTYHPISEEEFIASYNSYRDIVDLDMIKLLFYKGKAVGFFMSAPDYGNLSSRKKTPYVIMKFLNIKRKPWRYVMLYMGVMPEHTGAGMALVHSIMLELAKKGTPSIGSLIRKNNPNYDYAKEYMTGRYEYEFLERRFSISDYLRRGEKAWGEDEYIAERDMNGWRYHSFTSFVRDVRKCAHWMTDRGFLGKNIGIYSENRYEWMVVDIAVMGFIGPCFPIDAQYGEFELLNILRISDMKVLFYSEGKADIVDEIKKEFANIEFILIDGLCEKISSFSDSDDLVPVSPYDTSKVIFTSGTSELPKGVMLSQANMFSNWNALFKRTTMTHEDGILLVLPLNHVYAGIAAFLYTLASGMKIYLGTPEPHQCLDDFSNVKPSVFIGVPLLADRMWSIAGKTNDPAGAFGGNLKYFYCGGTEIDNQLKQNYIDAGIPFIEAYGLSETSSVVALDVVGDYRQGSAGILLESIEAVIDHPDEDGIGELLVRGGSRMSGYYKMPELNKAVLDNEGFFHTGDYAKIDESRHIYMMGRKKRMIITSNGKNVYPLEVEERVCQFKPINRATLYQENDRLHLKVWYEGDEAEVKRYLDTLREELPKYMRYETYECIEDKAGRRLK